MTDLFAHLYLDEDVSLLLADLLRTQGFRVTTAHQAGNLHLTDEEQLSYAVTHGMTIVTHNRRDFEQLATAYVAAGRPHFGILICVRRPEPQLAARLLQVLDEFTADELRDLTLYL